MSSLRRIALLLLALDFTALFSVFNLVALARGLPTPAPIVTPLLAPFLLQAMAIYLIDGYKSRTDMLSVDYTSQHVIALTSAFIATLLLTYVIITHGYPLQESRGVIALSFLALTPITLGYRRLIYQRQANVRGHRSVIFFGDPASCRAFREECAKTKFDLPVIFSIPETVAPPPKTDDLKLEPFDDLLARVDTGVLAVEAIVLRESNRELELRAAQQLVELYFKGVPTYTLELFHQVYWQKIPLYRLNPTWLFQEGFEIAREPVAERAKRINDVVLSFCGLVLGAPFMLVAAMAIWIEDRGSVFFVQTRVGKNRSLFRVFKLRSMRQDGLSDPYTHEHDRRITRVGHILRATRLDELPQLWNVLRGEMSLIGPRAEWDRLVAEYEKQIPSYHFRHLVKPGITGWAQVKYPYGASLEDTVRKLEYDLYYIRHFSFMLDASIVLKTIHIMLFGKGR